MSRMHWPIQGSVMADHHPPRWLLALVRNRPAAAGFVVTVLLAAAAILAPVLTPFPPLRGVGSALSPPVLAHPLGTDDLGRDVLAEVLYGLRTSLLTGFTASLISLVLGVLVGAPAGDFGG